MQYNEPRIILSSCSSTLFRGVKRPWLPAAHPGLAYSYTVSRKKQDTKLLSIISSLNINLFKNLYWHILLNDCNRTIYT